MVHGPLEGKYNLAFIVREVSNASGPYYKAIMKSEVASHADALCLSLSFVSRLH